MPKRWIQYGSWLTVEASRELAKQLRASGEYAGVRLGNYLVDEGKRYSKVYVKRKERNGVLE